MRVWAFAALRLFACVSNGGYAKMNALFLAKNSIYNVVACILLKGVRKLDLLGSKAGLMMALQSLSVDNFLYRILLEKEEVVHLQTHE